MLNQAFFVGFYIVLFSFIFWKWKSLGGGNGAWKQKWIVALFLLKVGVGIFYGWSSHRFLNAPDSKHFFNLGKVVYSSLENEPKVYAQLVFLPLPQQNISTNLLKYKAKIPVWRNRGSYTIVRFHAFFNVFTKANYFANIVLWNVLSTIGIVLLWRCIYQFANQIKQKRFIQLFLCLNPAFLFWVSGAHKEGISVFAIGLTLFFFTKLSSFPFLKYKKKATTNAQLMVYLMAFVMALILLFCVRHYYFATLFLALITFGFYYFVKQLNLKPFIFYLFFYGILAVLLFSIDLIFETQVLAPLVNYRNEFISVTQGRSDFNLPIIELEWWAVLSQIPSAIINPFLRPFPTDIIHFRSFLACVESYFQLGLLLFTCIIPLFKQQKTMNLLSVFFLFFGFIAMLIIGLVADNSGAIVRYRSVPYMFLMLAGLLYYFQKKNFEIEN